MWLTIHWEILGASSFRPVCSWTVCACVVFIHAHFMSCSLHSFHLYFLFLWHHHLFPFNAINTGSIIKFPLWNVARKNKEIHQLPELKEDWWVPWGSMPKEAFVQDFFSQLGLKCGLLWAVLAQMWKKSGILWSSDYRTASFTNENLFSWCKKI